MSNFHCEKCGKAILEDERGYYTSCEHYPLSEKNILSLNMKGRISHQQLKKIRKIKINNE